jgi:hypothetical protein
VGQSHNLTYLLQKNNELPLVGIQTRLPRLQTTNERKKRFCGSYLEMRK